MSILSNEYKNSIAPALMTKFGYKSVMQIPKLEKVVINVGAGEAKENAKAIDSISGQGKLQGHRRYSARPESYHRSEGNSLPRKEVGCELQAPRGYADRCEGNASR